MKSSFGEGRGWDGGGSVPGKWGYMSVNMGGVGTREVGIHVCKYGGGWYQGSGDTCL